MSKLFIFSSPLCCQSIYLLIQNMFKFAPALTMVNKYIVGGLENTILSIVMSPTNIQGWVGEYQ